MRFNTSLLLLVALICCSCESSQTPEPADVKVELLALGADPDGAGIERITDLCGTLIVPGALLMDETPVIVLFASGRIIETTWGDIKKEYGG